MEKHKILVFSDMHGDRRAVGVAKAIAQKEGVELIAYLGDFSKKIGDVKANLEDVDYMLSQLMGVAGVRSLFGNCDVPEVAQLLEKEGVSLHNRFISIGKTGLVGRGGSHPTPFHTPSEFGETEIEGSLSKAMDEAAQMGMEKLILLTHEPPANTKADELPTGHVGSMALRHIVENYQPNLNVCGHIHEAKSVDYVNDTKVINVGPSSGGNFLLVTVDGEIETQEVRV
jgi:Icc-related predicted phosphoesterase